ncbi:MAG: hypothetical protein KAR42_04810 [candidate division Zixibacteria bacterium]|nr:hypothetical protein [candidate division Zixibacteria bacterium]
MENKQQTIKEITKEFYERLALYDPESFVRTINSLSLHLDRAYKSLLHQHDSRIFFGNKIESLELTEYEYNSFQLMRVIAIVTEELKRNHDDLNKLQEIIQSTTNKCNLPEWFKKRIVTYIPLLFIRNQNSSEESAPESYTVFLRGKIRHLENAELAAFKNKTNPGDFNIFIENTDSVNIYINNNPKLFRAGNYHPFNILTLFLHRLGEALTYREIYHLAIKPTEKTVPRDYSKKVYDYLKLIKKTIHNCKTSRIDPDEWFQRDHNKGVIHISKSINGCLITSDNHLFI